MVNSALAFVIATVMAFTPICGGTQLDVIADSPRNYTEETSFTITLDNSKELYTLLKALLIIPDEYEEVCGVEKFLETLFSIEGKLLVQADVSDDMKKAQVAMTSQSYDSIEYNRNLKIDISANLGIWLKYDITDSENPVFELIYSVPDMDKYVYLDLIDVLPEEEREEFISYINESIAVGNSEETKTFIAEVFEKHADIKVSRTSATMKIDNKAFVGIIKDITDYMISVNESRITDVEGLREEISSIEFDKLRILGEDGIVITYKLIGGNIVSSTTDVDVCINIAEMYNEFAEDKWEVPNAEKIDFTISTESDFSKIGSTKVDFPTLTEENSISLAEKIKEDMAYDEYYEDYVEYPHYYVSGYSEDAIKVVGDEIYVPLRSVLEDAYDDSLNISFENGVITATSDYFFEFKTIQLENGSDKVYLDGVEKTTSEVFIIDGTTYVNYKLFIEYFGWEHFWADYDLIEKTYSYGFYTRFW